MYIRVPFHFNPVRELEGMMNMFFVYYNGLRFQEG